MCWDWRVCGGGSGVRGVACVRACMLARSCARACVRAGVHASKARLPTKTGGGAGAGALCRLRPVLAFPSAPFPFPDPKPSADTQKTRGPACKRPNLPPPPNPACTAPPRPAPPLQAAGQVLLTLACAGSGMPPSLELMMMSGQYSPELTRLVGGAAGGWACVCMGCWAVSRPALCELLASPAVAAAPGRWAASTQPPLDPLEPSGAAGLRRSAAV